MEGKRGTTVLLTVIGIATLLVALVGATFAYFTASVSGTDTDTDVTITSATLGQVTFSEGTAINLGSEETPVYPNAWDSTDFSIASAAASTIKVDYDISLSIAQDPDDKDFTQNPETPGITNVQYLVCLVSSENASEETTDDSEFATGVQRCSDVATVSGDVTTFAQSAVWTNVNTADIGDSITLTSAKLGSKATRDTWRLYVRLAEVDDEQNYDQGKRFAGSLAVNVSGYGDNTGYTTDENGNVVEYTPAG